MRSVRVSKIIGLIGFACFASFPVHAGELLNVGCAGAGQEFAMCKSAAQTWAKNTGNEVRIYEMPANSSDRLKSYRWMLTAANSFLDVIQIDIVWTGLLASNLLDLRPYTHDAEKEHFSSVVANSIVQGRLVAIPWFIDAGLLYYRSDLLKKYGITPPKTWEELTASAQKIQAAERAAGQQNMWGYVWQGRAYEGLTCNALEWFASAGGGTLLDSKGRSTVNNPQALQMLRLATSWVGTISPIATNQATEEESRKFFQQGNAVYMRNWPYAWSLAQEAGSPIKGKVGVTVLPAGSNGKHASTLGGQQLAVPATSKKPALATDLVLYLSSAEEQKKRAIAGSFNPTRPALYKDSDVLKAIPSADTLSQALSVGVARPAAEAGLAYERVSNTFNRAISDALNRRMKPEDALAYIEKTTNQIQAETAAKKGASHKP
jgi:trehalose/maltose transport system substrate-binding protein